MEKIVNNDFNKKKVVGRSVKKIINAFRSLVSGGQDSEYKGPVDSEEVNKFEDVLRAVKEQGKSFMEAMRADGRLSKVHIREDQAQSRGNAPRSDISKDIAD